MTNVSTSRNTDNNMNLILNQCRCHQVNAKVLTHTDYKDCDYNDRRKRIKNMYEIYEKCALWIIHTDMEK
jgi:small nuclear ribonucleoprotein (snRNP)-like protein